MTLESSIREHVRTGEFYQVDVFSYPKKLEDTTLGRIQMRLAYIFPNRLAQKVTSEALLSLSKEEAQEKLPRILAQHCYDGNFGYFGKVVKDRF
ncbi:MAG: hypothetical protein UT39_C0021G0024 [Candidatus Woesebacteria bacterium GW2011_GWA1_39_21]|uniref:Uncharacterized protein n=1 Tax=Candidatus Woesebacteria bacterium GW2011_GWA1_39_21 TaxID=1618550 RepID=A0A0G0R9A4_9BACT|nr:MAG: hypothetical protein UT39_C0021G0024 [Candidatus Woesebacteria bacterium GW2011_GWA1_39_21]